MRCRIAGPVPPGPAGILRLVFVHPLRHQLQQSAQRLQRIFGAAGIHAHRRQATKARAFLHALDEGDSFRSQLPLVAGGCSQVFLPIRILEHLWRSHVGQQVDDLKLRGFIQFIPFRQQAHFVQRLARGVAFETPLVRGVQVQSQPFFGQQSLLVQRTVDLLEGQDAIRVQVFRIGQHRVDHCFCRFRERCAVRPGEVGQRFADAEPLEQRLRPWRPWQGVIKLAMAHHRRR